MKSSDTPKELVEIRCTFVERTYRSGDAQYCVCIYRQADGNTFSAVGSDLPEMEYPVRLSGEWKKHPTYGDQFQVEMVVDILPEKKSDVVKFILSLADSFTREEAKALAAAHPVPELWDVLYHSPEKLYPICNIGSEKILCLQRRVKRLAVRKDLATFLGDELPMSKWQYQKICDLFTDDPAKMLDAIKEEPFLLIHAGYHFTALDKFSAAHTSFAVDDYRRLLAATQSALLDAQTESHVALPEQNLLQKLNELLRPMGSVSTDTLRGFLKYACSKGDIIYSGTMFYLRKAFEEEMVIAEKLAAMAALPPKDIDRKKFLRLMAKYGKQKGFSLSPNQQDAVWTVLTHPVCVITGGPGTGKSTILDAVLFCWKSFHHDHDWCLMAPTGKAAVRITETTGESASTIHSMLDLNVSSGFEHAELSDVTIPHGLSIVDESSMSATRSLVKS